MIILPSVICMEKLCQICNKNKIEAYQLDFDACFDCWMNHSTPKIC
jgi:hypothetical protein